MAFNVITYLKETKAELKHVVWPTRRQTVVFTMFIIALSAIVAVLLGFFDQAINFLLSKLLS